MAILTIEYKTDVILPSCIPAETELQAGEQVKITHNKANPLWSDYIKAFLSQPAFTDDDGKRVYKFEYDDGQLNGGNAPDCCDFDTPVCWTCCDEQSERLEKLINAMIDADVLIEHPNGDLNFVKQP